MTSRVDIFGLGSKMVFLRPRWMTRADVALADDVLLSHIVACGSEGVVTVPSAHIKLNVWKFIGFMSHSVVCNKL